MTWQKIGEINPTFDWQDIGVPIVGNTILRFTWEWDGPTDFPGKAKLWVAQVYDTDSWYNFKSIYASKNKRILIYDVPTQLFEAGLGVYFPEFKLSNNSRFTVNGELKVIIEEWNGSVTSPLGGEYE